MTNGTVHIIDDDPGLRTALLRFCRSAGYAATDHADAQEILAMSDLARPACFLLDVRLGGESGLAVQERLRALGCTIPVVFLTGVGTIPMTVRAMRGGAVEFLTKPVCDDDLLAALRRALESDAAALAEIRRREQLSGRLSSLTDRERDVFGLAIGGLMNKQIAAELGLSEITVKVHKRRVMEKMEARSLADLVRMADQLGVAASRHR